MAIFYSAEANLEMGRLIEDEHRHCSIVLRFKIGDEIEVINAQGLLSLVKIISIHKDYTVFSTIRSEVIVRNSQSLAMAISPTKSADRNEWLVEKATEIGIDQFYFFQSSRGERPRINHERMRKIALSAIKQSKQYYLPDIYDMISFKKLLGEAEKFGTKMIAHCDGAETSILSTIKNGSSMILLIGPEGDFSSEEIKQAEGEGFSAVSLGANRLRTETAAVVGATLMKFNQ